MFDDLLEITGPPTAGGLLAEGVLGAQAYIGKSAWWRVPTRNGTDDVEIAVTIKNIRGHFGTLDFLVEPVGGRGTRWVRADYLTLIQEG